MRSQAHRIVSLGIIGLLLAGGLAVGNGNAAAKVSVKIVSLTTPVTPGTDATLEAQTAPNATCTITVQYASGASQAASLSQKSANAQGAVSWTWRVGANTPPGKYPVTVSCSAGGKEVSAKRSLQVKASAQNQTTSQTTSSTSSGKKGKGQDQPSTETTSTTSSGSKGKGQNQPSNQSTSAATEGQNQPATQTTVPTTDKGQNQPAAAVPAAPAQSTTKGSLAIRIISLTSPVAAGKEATIQVNTASNADCQIVVKYKSGPSKAKGLEPKTADARGQISWTWHVGNRTTPGGWPVSVTCTSGGREGTTEATFEVTAP